MIRSGFGIYTNQAAYNIIQNAALNLPFYFAKTVNNSLAGGNVQFNTEDILTAPRLVQREQHQPQFQD